MARGEIASLRGNMGSGARGQLSEEGRKTKIYRLTESPG